MFTVRPRFLLNNSFGFLTHAMWHATADTANDVNKAIEFAAQHTTQLLPLGSGSNLVMSPTIDACVVTFTANDWRVVNETDERVLVRADAGCLWAQFVTDMMHAGYHGLENLAGIPGTVGAAPVQNIGAYGTELSDYMTELVWTEFAACQSVVYRADACEFGYRTSCFKQQTKRTGYPHGMITEVTFCLEKQFQPRLTHRYLQHLPENCSPYELHQAVLSKRATSLPDAATGNAGSFFTNPVVDNDLYQKLHHSYPNIACRQHPDGHQLHAGWLIDAAGWKGHRDQTKPIGTHTENALVLVNYAPHTNQVTGDDIRELASCIVASVEAQFGVRLEQEPSNW